MDHTLAEDFADDQSFSLVLLVVLVCDLLAHFLCRRRSFPHADCLGEVPSFSSEGFVGAGLSQTY